MADLCHGSSGFAPRWPYRRPERQEDESAPGQGGDRHAASRFLLGVNQLLQAIPVLDGEGRAFDLDELFSLEVGEEATDGLAGGTDHLRDFFVREGEANGVGAIVLFHLSMCEWAKG